MIYSKTACGCLIRRPNFSLGTLLARSLCLLALCGQAARSQVVPDASLGAESSRISSPGPDAIQIDGGARRGSNLFHSFDEFSVPLGREALFNNDASVANIISRVTGDGISNIDGTLRSHGTANLYLLNPNGIVFGPNARLDIGGSFLATTADSFSFPDGTSFGSNDAIAPPLLSINVPAGLQFGPSSAGGTIRVEGGGNFQELNGTATAGVLNAPGSNSPGLAVPSGETLTLIGRGVTIDGGTLRSHGGQIYVGSVGVGTVALNPERAPNYSSVTAFRELRLQNAGAIDTSGRESGSIQLQGSEIALTEGSIVFARPLADAAPDLATGKIEAIASDRIELSGINPVNAEGSAIVGGTLGAARGIDIFLAAPEILMREGGIASSSTFGSGNAGDIVVSSDFIVLDGISQAAVPFPSGLFALSALGAPGLPGRIQVTASRRLVVRNDALIDAGNGRLFANGGANPVVALGKPRSRRRVARGMRGP